MIFFTHLWDLIADRPAAYRVIYPNGRKTWRMSHSHAWNLKEIFGGHLVYDPPEREVLVSKDTEKNENN
jgi:hypothetical protein